MAYRLFFFSSFLLFFFSSFRLGVEFVSIEVITGIVLEAGSRMKIEASRDRARVNAKVMKWTLETVMGSKKAAHAHSERVWKP